MTFAVGTRGIASCFGTATRNVRRHARQYARDTDHVGVVLVHAHFCKWIEASHETVAHVAIEECERIGGVLAGLHCGDLLGWRGR